MTGLGVEVGLGLGRILTLFLIFLPLLHSMEERESARCESKNSVKMHPWGLGIQVFG